MTHRMKRVFSWEAVLIAWLFSLVVGTVVGLATGLIVQSACIGVLAGASMVLFSLSILFNGSDL